MQLNFFGAVLPVIALVFAALPNVAWGQTAFGGTLLGDSPVAKPPLPESVRAQDAPLPPPLAPARVNVLEGGSYEGERKRVEFFPQSLLWEPKLADRRDPKIGFTFSDVDSVFSRQTADPQIGNTLALFRWEDPYLAGWEHQMDIFGQVTARFASSHFMIADDYRAGVLFTSRFENWVSKLGWEHTSTHLGDNYKNYITPGITNNRFERDEAVIAVGYLYANQFRAYGQAACAFWRDIQADTPNRVRFDVGFDWYKRVTTGARGQPFAAFNTTIDPAVNYNASVNLQVGWMWRTDNKRLSQFRLYGEFYDGHSIFGQLFRNRERYAGFGIMLDY